ncbi:hypothetical protein MHK_009067, partial [Candidatus Magnetomorum sp. HK-1]
SCFERAQSKESTINTHQTSYPKSKKEYAQRAWENFKYNLSHYGVDQIRAKNLLDDPMSKQVIFQMGGLDQARKWNIDHIKENEFIKKYQELPDSLLTYFGLTDQVKAVVDKADLFHQESILFFGFGHLEGH